MISRSDGMYLFFESALEGRKQEIEDSLRAFLHPSKPISSYICENSFCSRKPIKAFNMVELIRYYWIRRFGTSALMVVLPLEMKSDAKLIEKIGSGYLGSVSRVVKKNELQALAQAYRRISQVESSRKFFSVPAYVVKERLKQAPFSESEIKKLIRLQDKNLRLVDQFIQKKVKKLKQDLNIFPSLLKRGIG